MIAPPPAPFTDAEIAALLRVFEECPRIGLAVSGGPDSTALMLLARRWLDQIRPEAAELVVLTVDHGLRAESAKEAATTAATAKRFGFEAIVLPWLGEKPRSAIQAAARHARYELLTKAARQLGLAAIATGHTRDDQAETLLMRLARGSGVDGLAAMPPVGDWQGVPILRPLLDVDKSRLAALVEANGIDVVDDPSNGDARFERVRLRQQWAALEAAGLTTEMLALSARRIGRARAALDCWTGQVLEAKAAYQPEGWAGLQQSDLVGLPDEIVIRLLQRLIAAVGGDPVPASLSQIETVVEDLRQTAGSGQRFRNRTLARCTLRVGGTRLVALRETGREDLPECDWDNTQVLRWDHRFDIRPQPGQGALTVRALSARELPDHVSFDDWSATLPRQVALGLPTLWKDGRLIAVPAPLRPLVHPVARLIAGEDFHFLPRDRGKTASGET